MSFHPYSLIAALLVSLAPLLSATAASAPFCAEISIVRQQTKADGVELTERYRERFYRTDTIIAFERIRPTQKPPISEAAPSQHHAHPDSMVRRYQQQTGGSIDYSLFDDHGRREIRLQPNEFAEFGFDGNFSALHALADARLLAQLSDRGQAGRDRTLREPDREVRWSGRHQIVLFQQQRWPGGEQTLTVTPLPQCVDPNRQRAGFTVIDYADTLD